MKLAPFVSPISDLAGSWLCKPTASFRNSHTYMRTLTLMSALYKQGCAVHTCTCTLTQAPGQSSECKASGEIYADNEEDNKRLSC